MSDEDKIRAVITAWGAASEAGDLQAQLTIMTDDANMMGSI